MHTLYKITLLALGGLAVLTGAAFGILQTGGGKAWLAQTATRQLSSPGSPAKIGAITGLVPFDMRVSRIEMADVAGPWLEVDDAALGWSPASLLTGRLLIDRLSADTIRILHSPAPSQPSTGGGFSLPRLPVGIELKALEIGQLVFDPALSNADNAGAHVSANGLLGRGRADLNMRLTRIDSQPGFATLDAHYDQAADQLGLDFDLQEPTGILLDEGLGRTDKVPLRVTVKGDGPLAGWKGKLTFTAGDIAHGESTIALAQTKGSRIALDGSAAIAALLPENIRPLVGDAIEFQFIAAEDGAHGMMIAPSRIALGGMTLSFSGARSDAGALTGNAHFTVPDLNAFGPAGGTIDLDATLSGTAAHPLLDLAETGRIVIGGIALDGLSANAHVESKGKSAAQGTDVDAIVDVKSETVRDAIEGGASYGPLTIHLAGTADSIGRIAAIKDIGASGAGLEFKGNGTLQDGAAQGSATLNAADLSVVGKMLGQPIGGAVTTDIKIETAPDRTIALQLTGGGDRLRTGIPALDALLSGHIALTANGARNPDGKIALGKLALGGGRARLEAEGGFDPADRAITASLTAELADLGTLSGALQSPLAGTGSVSAKIGGTLDQPAIDAKATVDRLAFGATRIDHLDAALKAPQGLNGVAAMTAHIASGKLNQTVDAEMRREGAQLYRIGKLTMSGSGGAMNGALLADLAKGRVSGRLNAAIDDLSVWSGVAGAAVAGKVTLALDLPGDANRQGPVAITLDRFAYGPSPNAIGIAHAALNGTLSGDINRPTGALDLALSGVSASGAALSNGDAHVTAAGAKADFRAHLAGRFQQAGTLDLTGSVARNRDETVLRLTTLAAGSGSHKLALTRPLTVTVAPQYYAMAGLALAVDDGSVEGDAALGPKRISADIRLRQFPLHSLGALAGKDAVGGTLDGRVTLDGTPKQPQAKLTLVSKGLDLQTDGPMPRPALSLALDAGWQGDRADLNLKLASGTGEALTLTGSAPFAFDLATLRPRPPANPSLALKLTGGGKLENLTSIVPLGEDRMTGAFTVDVAVTGTLAAPRPTGRIAIAGGTYANMALGTQLSGIDLALDGAGERFVLDHLTATDAAAGKLTASGAIDLGVSPATVGFDLGFSDFLVARGDNATIDADGALKLAGTTAEMKMTGKLAVRRAELYIPDKLPASVVSLDVTEIGGRRKADAPKGKPLAPIGLQIAVDAPGQVFVRGHGIVSEWRGHTDIGGTTAGPVMTGQLSIVNGTIDLLSQNFTIDRGNIGFDGGRDINPILDVQASAAASGITATVNVTGTARAPKIDLGSIPALPRDEILSRILFGENIGSLTASQGLQLAQAAASLAQGGPGVLDRVRSSIGLDRLDLTGGGGNATGTQGAAKGTTVSGGKYIANGVFVGVAQGATANSSQARVEVEIAPNISVNSTFGTASGSGFGAKYSVDY